MASQERREHAGERDRRAVREDCCQRRSVLRCARCQKACKPGGVAAELVVRQHAAFRLECGPGRKALRGTEKPRVKIARRSGHVSPDDAWRSSLPQA